MSLFNQLRELEEQGIDLIEVLGQDRYIESPQVLQKIIRRLDREGENLYSELLHYLTYRRFPPEEAEELWNAIMCHKESMGKALGRRVSFRVAALDHLSSVDAEILRGAHLIARPEFESVLSYVNVDEVTAVFSRRYFNERLVAELNRARRYGSPLSLLLLDIDDFKTVNDREGHVYGDKILRCIGRQLRDSTRQADAVCRFGGDEFAILLPETAAAEAFTAGERARCAVADIPLVSNGQERSKLTSSIGGATYPADCDEAEELVALADQMCLDAKRAGKDRVRMYGLMKE